MALSTDSHIYAHPFFLSLYKLFKWFYGLLTGTTELYRICDAVVQKEMQITPHLVYKVDLCILYSSKLDSVRRKFESREQQYQEPFQELLAIKRFPGDGSVQRLLLLTSRHAAVLDSIMTRVYSTFTLMHQLNARAATRYDSSIQSNERKLEELWQLLMPNEELGARYTLQWQKIGFQGKDPSTDFRAMGMLGLDDLLYLARNYSSIAHRILAASHHPQSWFSFAIVGITITAYCLRLVRTRQLQLVFYENGVTKDVYHQVYCQLFDEFEKHWSGLTSRPSVMDFNMHFRSFQIKTEHKLLEQRFKLVDLKKTN